MAHTSLHVIPEANLRADQGLPPAISFYRLLSMKQVRMSYIHESTGGLAGYMQVCSPNLISWYCSIVRGQQDSQLLAGAYTCNTFAHPVQAPTLLTLSTQPSEQLRSVSALVSLSQHLS